MWALKKLGGGSSSTLSHCLPMVSTHALRLRFQLWIFRLRVLHKIDSIGILQRVYQHTQNRSCHCCEGPNNMYQKYQYRDTAPPINRQRGKKQLRTPSEPKMQENDKTCFVIQPACLCPNSFSTKDDRQMRMTNKDTPHRQRIEHQNFRSHQGGGCMVWSPPHGNS